MSFWVYENRIFRKAMVHKGSCHFCNEGKGVNNIKGKRKNDIWHGPYSNYTTARAEADAIGKRYEEVLVSDCQSCHPS